MAKKERELKKQYEIAIKKGETTLEYWEYKDYQLEKEQDK